MMDFSPILISFKTAIVATLFTFLLGIGAAYFIFTMKKKSLKIIFDIIFTLPMVLPPTVAGFFLLLVFGLKRPVGSFLLSTIGFKIAFTWYGTVIAAIFISFPLMYRSAQTAFEQVNQDYLQVSQTLGMSKWKIFRRILLPLATPGIISGGILAFTRAIGEFGATAMLAGNIAGQTRTLPLAIYSAVSSSNMSEANDYVFILVAVAFLAIGIMNMCTLWQRRYKPRRDSL